MYKKTDICHLNKEVWIPHIKEAIVSWQDFSNSIFCEKEEDKQSALDTANDLQNLLSLVESDSLTNQQFERLRFYIW